MIQGNGWAIVGSRWARLGLVAAAGADEGTAAAGGADDTADAEGPGMARAGDGGGGADPSAAAARQSGQMNAPVASLYPSDATSTSFPHAGQRCEFEGAGIGCHPFYARRV